MGNLPTGTFLPRTVGILCIALGFVLGMQGLDDPDSIWLPTALGLIVTGLLAQGYVLFLAIRRLLLSRED